ncbi:phosphodiester glycosidase family protein [Myxococcota bacterium]|nr:phosphodiester glycosidase family protein [Myxococcota bacterium]
MTGDPMTDRSATGALVGTGLLVLVLCWPGAPGAVEVSAAPVAPERTVQVDAPQVILQGEGLVLEQQAWRFQGQAGTAWRVRVPLPGAARVQASEEVVAFTELLPTDDGPWAAINGGFYEDGAMGLVVSDGVEHTGLSRRGGSGVFAWSPAGPQVLHRDRWAAGPPQALQSIDRLVDAGRNLVKAREGAPLAARSAVVVGSDALWLVALAGHDSIAGLWVDGVQLRGTSGRGLPLWAFADYLVDELGAVQALNLDGAISTQLAVQVPGQRFAVRGEAGTINAVVLRPPSSP